MRCWAILTAATRSVAPDRRSRTSTNPSASPWPTMTMFGIPMSSASLSLTPAETSARSSWSTPTPAAANVVARRSANAGMASCPEAGTSSRHTRSSGRSPRTGPAARAPGSGPPGNRPPPSPPARFVPRYAAPSSPTAASSRCRVPLGGCSRPEPGAGDWPHPHRPDRLGGCARRDETSEAAHARSLEQPRGATAAEPRSFTITCQARSRPSKPPPNAGWVAREAHRLPESRLLARQIVNTERGGARSADVGDGLSSADRVIVG
jgi:hypothetical protein